MAAQSVLDWLLRDRATGRWVIAQWPNLPLWLFIGTAALGWIVEWAVPAVPPGGLRLLQGLSLIALAWWALDELVRGVNPWRRGLGAAVLAFIAVRVVGAFQQ